MKQHTYAKGKIPEGEILANSFPELAEIAIKIIRENQKKLVVVCGPITTGGLGSVERNLLVIQKVNEYLKGGGLDVFDQIPFEPTLWALKEKWLREGNIGYCMPILEEFYRPVYETCLYDETRCFYRAYFIPGWIRSDGAVWERNEFRRLGIDAVDLEVDLINSLTQFD